MISINKILKKLVLLPLMLLTLTSTTLVYANAEQDFFATIGVNDADGDGKVQFDDFLKGGNKGKVVSFTNFKGELAPPSTEGYAAGLTQATDLRTYVLNVTNFALGFLGLIAVVVIIWAGFQYVTDGGKGDASGKGKKAIVAAVSGLIIVMSSFAIVNTVLLAPSDSESGSTSAGGTAALRGVSGRETVSFFTRELAQIAEDLVGNYQFYAGADASIKQAVLNIETQVENIKGSCVLPNFGSCNDSVINIIDSEMSKLGSLTSSRFATADFRKGITDVLNNQRIVIIRDLNEYQKAINSKSCNKLNTGSGACITGEQDDIRARWKLQKEAAQAAIDRLKESPKTQYSANLVQYKTRITNLQRAIGTGIGVAKTAFEALVGASATDLFTGADFPKTDNLRAILSNLAEIYSILSNLKYVNVNLTADVTEGNAPLIVNFSTVGSSDPSGQPINNAAITWELNSDDGVLSKSDFSLSSNEGATNSATFTKEGTYRMRVIVPASTADNPATGKKFNEEIANGIAYIDIKVNPPSAKINLKTQSTAQINGTEDQGTNVMLYNATTEQLEIDRSIVYYSLDEASAGITFDASLSKDSSNAPLNSSNSGAKVKWNFGVPSEFSDSLLEVSGNQDALKPKVNFTKNGNYRIVMEVVSKNNVVDRKIFTLIVADKAPRISRAPKQAKVNEQIEFYGGLSSVSGGQLQWAINGVNKDAVAGNYVANSVYDCTGQNIDTLKCTFKKAGTYTVDLWADDIGPASHIIQVTSNAPFAGYNSKRERENFPSTFLFDTSKLAYDPDDIQENAIPNPLNTTALEYKWDISTENCIVIANSAKLISTPADLPNTQTSCAELREFSSENANVILKFTEVGDHEVKLTVREKEDQSSVSEPYAQIVNVVSILSLSWAEMNPVGQLPEGKVTFNFSAPEAVAYELDFGNGNKDTGEIKGQPVKVETTYREVGSYQANLTVFDADDASNTISRRITIGNSDNPIPVITVNRNSVEIEPSDFQGPRGTVKNVIVASRKDVLLFDADKSLNTDGTKRLLNYSWNINNNEKQSVSKSISHQFKDLSDFNQTFPVRLTVTNQRDLSQKATAEILVLVVGEAPSARSLVGVPENGNNLTTPVKVNVRLVNPEDPDGQIVQYKWWYTKLEEDGRKVVDEERRGLVITQAPQTQLTIGTSGESGKSVKYKIGAEIMDNDNGTAATDEPKDSPRRLDIPYPTLTVINGPNKPPLAKFTVDKTTVQAGESVNFISSSSDPDAGDVITNYLWDFGDGSAVVQGENRSVVAHTFTKGNREGYRVKLRVSDSNGSESTSEPIRIIVESIAKPPVAAFTSAQQGTSKTVSFSNSSRADEAAEAKLVKFTWDFDIASDADGDGTADNDLQSTDPAPSYTYPEYRVYRARLTVTDDQGQVKFINNFVNVKAPVPAAPAAPVAPTSPTTGGSTNRTTDLNSSISANMFNSTKQVDIYLVLGSIGAYGMLYLISSRSKKKRAQSHTQD